MSNQINPDHYKGAAGIEAIDVIECWGFGNCFHLGSALAYLLRAGKKPGADLATDLKKTLWYLDRFKHEISHDEEGERYRGIQWPGPWDMEHPLVVGGTVAISSAFSLEGHVKDAVETLLALSRYDGIIEDDGDRVLMEMLVMTIEHVNAAISEVEA